MTTDAERDDPEEVGPAARSGSRERDEARGPLDEPTLPMGSEATGPRAAGAAGADASHPDRGDDRADRSRPDRGDDRADRSRPEELDTTTWGGGVAPPVPQEDDRVVEGGDTSSAPARPGLEEQETVVSAAPFDEGAPRFEEEATRPPDEEEESSLHPLLLERIEPPLGRGERIRLDASHARIEVGRAEENDLRLYTASASRHHAVIERDAQGRWTIVPVGERSIRIDGDEMQGPVPLELGMNVVLGQDHLRCVSEGLEAGERAARTAAEGLGEGPEAGTGAGSPLERLARVPRIGWIAGAIAVLAGGLLVAAC